MFDKREKRPLAVVERDEIDIVEDAGIGDAAQLSIGIAAAQRDRQVRTALFDRLRDAKCSIQIAGERHGQTDQRRLGPVKVIPECLQQEFIRETGWLGQRSGYPVER
jgi:hypothetical protein